MLVEVIWGFVLQTVDFGDLAEYYSELGNKSIN